MFSCRQCVCEKEKESAKVEEKKKSEKKKTNGSYPLAMCPSNTDIRTHRKYIDIDKFGTTILLFSM